MKILGLSGGKGGTGKSFLSVNLALAFAQRRKRVVLFDADLQLANLDVMLDIQPVGNLQHVVRGEATLREVLTPGPGGVQVVTGGSAVHGLMNAGPKRMAAFLSQIDDLRRDVDILIFDIGAGLDARVMTFLRLAEQPILVVTPEPTSVTDAYATAKTLWKREPAAQVGIVLNQVSSVEEARAVYQTLATNCQRFLGRTPVALGAVRRDAGVTHSIRRRFPLLLLQPDSPACEDIRALAAGIEQAPPRAA